jgi:hypothetical protein
MIDLHRNPQKDRNGTSNPTCDPRQAVAGGFDPSKNIIIGNTVPWSRDFEHTFLEGKQTWYV